MESSMGCAKCLNYFSLKSTSALFRLQCTQVFSVRSLHQIDLRWTPSEVLHRQYRSLSARLPVPRRSESFQEFLLQSKFSHKIKETDAVPADKINERHTELTSALVKSYSKIQEQYNLFYAHCMTDKQKRDSDLLPQAPGLRFLGDKSPSPFKKAVSSPRREIHCKQKFDIMGRKPLPKASSPLLFCSDNQEFKKDTYVSLTQRSTNSSTSQKAQSISIPSTPQKGLVRACSEQISNFTDRIPDFRAKTVAAELQKEMASISGQIFIMWHKMLQILMTTPRFVKEFLQDKYEEKIRQKWGENIFRDVQSSQDFSIPKDQDIGQMHDMVSKKRRTYDLQDFGFQSVLPIEDTSLFPRGSEQPIIFQEVYHRADNVKPPVASCIPVNNFDLSEQLDLLQQEKKDYKGHHLFVLVHGFQGRATDMRLFRDNISIMHPQSLFLISTINQQNTEGDIQQMGKNLAFQIVEHIKENSIQVGRLSFIGHSLGGLIIRASLRYLKDFQEKMHLYISLSSPHLGYMYNSSRVIDAGMWVLKKWSKSKCLQQLSMSDAKEYTNTYLYKLSQQKGLQNFKHVILVSSFQDSYAPFDSARIQICTKAARDPRRGNQYIEMARNLLSDLRTQILYRIDVNFKIKEKTLDSWIGRTAHIMFLECQPLMKMVVFKYPEFFS